MNIKLQSISSRIIEIGQFIKPGHSLRMAELLTQNLGDQLQRSRQALITFLSLLELGKLGFVSLYQTDVYGDIHIQGKKEIDGDVLSRVEEYGHINNEDVAQQMFKKAATEAEEREAAAMDFEDPDSMQMSLGEAEDIDLSEANFTEMATDDEIFEAELEADTEMASDPDREPEANV